MRVIAILLTLAACTGCGRSPSPTAGATDKVVLRSSAAAAGDEAEVDIRGIVEDAARKAEDRLPAHPRVTIEIKVDPEKVIDATGVGGVTLDRTYVLISVDRPLRPGTERWLAPAVAHELHHTARDATAPRAKSLLDDIVLEGLADHFAREVFPEADPFPWDEPLSMAREASLWASAQHIADGNLPFDYSSWMFGGNGLPRWAGYRLGYAIVSAYLECGGTAAEATAVDASEIVAAYTRARRGERC